MLKQRILTAAVLVPLMVFTLWFTQPAVVAALLGVFVLAAAWEWAGMSGLKSYAARATYLLALIVTVAAILPLPVLPVLAFGALWWLWAAVEVFVLRDSRRGVFAALPGRLIGGAFILLPAWLAAFYLFQADPRSPLVLLFLFVAVWVADSGAYFVGKAWGKTKIAPHISPGKSLEGVIGGVVVVTLLAVVAGAAVWRLRGAELAGWLAVVTVTVLISVVGDLMESKAKRIAGVKDSGALLPGHGGVFDRIDAFTAAAPVYGLGVAWLGAPLV